MIEKLGIRFCLSFIFCWLCYPLVINTELYMYYLCFSILISFIIEALYMLLKKYVMHLYPIIIMLLIIVAIGWYFVGFIFYLKLIIYAFVCVSFDLYRQYKITRLLDHALQQFE